MKKRLLSFILVLTMVAALLPAIVSHAQAEETALDISISSTDIKATNLYSETVTDGYIDEETQEEILSPEYTRYVWYYTCAVDVTINGDTYTNISLEELSGIVWNYGNFSAGIMDDQSYENQWKVGGTYTGTYYIMDMTNWETVWSVDLAITLCEPSVDIELSDITVDEMYKEGEQYSWDIVGTMTVTIDGTEYAGVSYWNLEKLLEEKYGAVKLSRSYSYSEEEGDPFNQNENPWEVGHEAKCLLVIRDEETGECLYRNDMVVRVCETKIASVSIAPISYYAYQGYARPEITANYKDGTSAIDNALAYSFDGGWPDEVGTHTVNITVADTFVIPVQVTVLENPTSGKLGDTVSWTFDTNTKTLTLSGTGTASCGTMSLDAEWWALLMELEVKHIVVEEGIEYLFDGIFGMIPTVESISLPSTLKAMPALVAGYNGSSEELNVGFESGGITTLVVPENITSWTSLAYYYCWGISDIYLPAGLTEVNLENLCYVAYIREAMELEALDTTIHFAGTEEQWKAIKYAVADDEYTASVTTGLTEEALLEILATFTITYNDPAECYGKGTSAGEEITVDNGTATVPDSVVEITEGQDVVIDVTDTKEEADSVVIGSATAEKIADANTAVEIKLPDASVSFDAAAMDTISDKAGDADITIVAKEVEDTTLNAEQKKALGDENVCAVLTLEVYAGNTKIADFGSGKVTIRVPFELPQGKTGSEYYVAYVAEDGTITAMPTSYADGCLVFETTHFSNYVVLEDTSETPKTGDGMIFAALLMAVCTTGLAVCVSKKKAF